jgi:NAD(P)-dependent dehydrogenase (short-subunit alcohol dehydrogenase family)
LVNGFDLTGKICIVTDAGRGMAEGLAPHGATVVLSGRTCATLEDTAAAIGEPASVVTADVSREADVLALRDHADEAVRHAGGRGGRCCVPGQRRLGVDDRAGLVIDGGWGAE